MEHIKEAGIFSTVTQLVDQLSDNPAAKMAAQEIAERLQSTSVKPAGSVGCVGQCRGKPRKVDCGSITLAESEKCISAR
jgi:hypothetical protein